MLQVSAVAINCLDNCSARTTPVIFNVFLNRHKCHLCVIDVCFLYFLHFLLGIFHQYHNWHSIIIFPLFSWHFPVFPRRGIRRIQSGPTTFQQGRILPSILFIGIYSNQILVHDPAVNGTKWSAVKYTSSSSPITNKKRWDENNCSSIQSVIDTPIKAHKHDKNHYCWCFDKLTVFFLLI